MYKNSGSPCPTGKKSGYYPYNCVT
ncbi:unnamed protein product [Nezara viridula]|uniref:Uncharacterized protein n=1 Tax=Nezara viridula TaxID=85310 RepID=A0A9P0E0I8_NEZVI|nr:unnamed protein product [Nezara viridula]